MNDGRFFNIVLISSAGTRAYYFFAKQALNPVF